MKITSKRGRKPPVEVKELEAESFDIIIIDAPSMTPEEMKNAEEAIRELRRQLDEIGKILDSGWYRRSSRKT